MDFKQLRYFAEVAEQENISRAAERLRIAQPALSRHIRRLEEQLGVELFLRVGRGIVLTRAGAMLRDHAARILRQLDRTREAVAAEGQIPQGTVAIGAPPSLAYVLFPRLIETYHALYPRVMVRLLEGMTRSLVEQLQADMLDMAVVSSAGPTVQPENSRGLILTPVGREGMCLFGPRDGPPLPRVMPVEAVGDLPLVLTGKPNVAREILETAAARARIPLRVVAEVDSQVVMKSLVKKGMGYSVAPFSTLHDDAADFATSRLEGISITRALARRADRAPTPAMSELMRIAAATIENLRRSGFFDPQHFQDRQASLA